MLDMVLLIAGVTPSPSSAPNAGTSGAVWAAWIAGGAAVLAALIAGAIALRQQRQTRILEKEKLKLEDQLVRERSLWEDERKISGRRELADQQFSARIQAQAEHADELQKLAIEYRLKVVDRLRRLKILDMSRSLDLDRLYVQLRVREEESPRFLTEQEVTDLTVGEPEQLLRKSQERLRIGARMAVPPEEALTRFERIIVVGDPGAGKTTMLRHLAFRIAREEVGPGVSLPVYVELRDFVDSGHADLLSYAATEMNERYGFPGAQPYIEQELTHGRAVLLLDGLDEVLGGASEETADAAYRKVSAEVDRLATRYSGAWIVVTCRRAGWRGGLPAFQTLEVLDFDWPEIQAFIKNWFSYDLSKGNGLRDSLSRNLRMQTLAANPLLLSLIAIVYERELELPERRAELYNRCVEVMLKDWDAHRDIRRFSRFTTDRKRDLLEEVAWHFHSAGRRYFAADELLTIIGDFLPTIDLGAEHAQAILNEIVAQYGLLKVQAHGWFGFLHLTLQEYFAAVAANERGQAAVLEVAKRRHSPWWEEVILLLAGRMADASFLLLALLGRDADASEPRPDESLVRDDDIFHSDLLLTARCLIGTPRLRVTWLRERLVGEIRQLLLQAPYSLVYERAARVLAEIGGEASRAELLSLAIKGDIDLGRRVAIVHAFADIGDAPAAPYLLSAFKLIGNHGLPIFSDDSRLYDEPGNAILDAFVKLRYAPAAPFFMKLVKDASDRRGKEADRFYYERIIRSIGELQDKTVKPEIWSFLRQVISGGRRLQMAGSLIYAVGQLGDLEDVEPLFALADNYPEYKGDVSAAVARIAGSAVAPRILEMIADSNTDNYTAYEMVRALMGLKSTAIVSGIFDILRNPDVDWQRRWHVADLLKECPRQVCESELADMLVDDALDGRVKIKLAIILATWDNYAGLTLLLNAFDEGTLPLEIALHGRSRGVSWSSWLQVADALQRLGERSIVSTLLTRYDEAISRREYRLADSLLSAIMSFKAVEVIPRVIDFASRDRSSISLWSLSAVLTASEMPVLRDSLKAHWPDVQDSVGIIIEVVGKVADKPEDVSWLLQLLVQASPHRANTIIEALEYVSQRAGVRAFSDGRVLPIAS